MKYHIDTIPIWDAAKKDGECLLCALERRTELGEAERYLGASVMEPDVRIQVNKKGFCRKHHGMLFTMSNRLGHALMLESHMIENRERLEKSWSALEKTGEQLKAAGLGDKLNGKAKAAKESAVQEARKIQEMAGTCVMCATIEENMLRYLHTFFHLYESDGESASAALSDGRLVVSQTFDLEALCLPERSPIVVSFILDEEGLLSVQATEPETGASIDFEKKVLGLSPQEVAEAKARVTGIAAE